MPRAYPVVRAVKDEPTSLLLTSHYTLNHLNRFFVQTRTFVENRNLQTEKTNRSLYINPIKPLPNVKRFKIEALAPWHPILEAHGIKKRQWEATINTIHYNNKSLNKYLLVMVKRLNKYRNEKKTRLFWMTAQILLRSSAYSIYGLYSINRKWHTEWTYSRVWSTLLSYSRLTSNISNHREIPYHITYIPKAGDSQGRPLGIPSLEWRIYLHNLNQILQIYLLPYHSKYQHGFWPGRGVQSAWHNILTRLWRSADIWEFDFRKFFDSISLTYLHKMLESYGIPENISTYLIDLQRSIPKGGEKIYNLPPREICRFWKQKLEHTKLLPEITKTDYRKFLKLPLKEQHPKYYLGVPQGSPTSPLLSCLLLNDFLYKKQWENIQYADDGIIFGKNLNLPEDLKIPEGTGIQLNLSKCHWIKRQNT